MSRRLWMGLAGGLALVAWVVGRPVLPLPPFQRPAILLQWVEREGVAAALFGSLRLGVVAVGAVVLGWGVVRWSALQVARVASVGRAVGWRGAVRVALGVSASGGAAAVLAGCGIGSSARAGVSPPAPVLEGVGVAGGSSAPVRPATGPAPGPVEAAPGPVEAAPGRIEAAPRRPAPPPPPSTPVPAGRTWTVRPGDSFWSIAEAVVGRAAPGSDRPTVGSYWSRLVSANRDRLPHPGDPDLLFPGDVVFLPPPA